jgi:hypothetical protein
MDKINEMGTSEKLIVGGGVLMLIASIFPWYSFDFNGFGSITRNGWQAPGSIWSVLAILIAVALAAVVLAVKFGNVKMPDLPENVTWGIVFAGGAAAVVVFMVLKLWRIADVPVGGFGFGFFIAVIAAALVAAGGFLAYQEEGGRRT